MRIELTRAELRPLRFLVSGVSAAVTEYGVFLVLHSLGLHLLIANSVSFCCGLLISFFLNKKWVFSSNGKTHVEFAQYFVLAMTNLVLSNMLIYIGVHWFGWVAWLVKPMTMIMIAAWNYLIFSKLIFRSRNKPDSPLED